MDTQPMTTAPTLRVAKVGTVVDFAPCANFGVIPTSVFAKVQAFPQLFRPAGTLKLEILPFNECVEADLKYMRSKRSASMSVKRIMVCLAQGFWPMCPMPKTGKCSCGSNYLYTDCCKVFCINMCKNSKCINPVHIKVVERRGAEDARSGKALRRVLKWSTLLNRLRPEHFDRLATMFTDSRSNVIRKAFPFLRALFGDDIHSSMAYDLVVFAHARKAHDKFESTPEQDDLAEGTRPKHRRYMNASAARFAKDTMYQHAEYVANELKSGNSINIAAYVRNASDGVVTIVESSFRSAVKRVQSNGGYYNKNKAKYDVNARAKFLVVKHKNLDAREIYAMIKDDVAAASLRKKNIMRVVKRAIRRRDDILRRTSD